MLLHEIALVLALEVDTPVYGILELDSVRDGFLQDLDTFRVLQTDEFGPGDAAQAVQQFGIVPVVEELDVVITVLEGVLHKMLDEVLGKVHVVVNVIEGHLRLDHPELGQMAGSVGVLRTECGTEGVDLSQRSGSELALELAAHCEACLLPEEILGIVDSALLVARERLLKVQGRHLEHLAGTFAVGLGDEGSVEVYEAL